MEFGNRKLVASAAILAGTLSLSGCTHYRDTGGQKHAPIISHNSMEMKYTDGAGVITFSCDGANLRIDSSEQFSKDVYLNDPACADGQFTIADLQKK